MGQKVNGTELKNPGGISYFFAKIKAKWISFK
jgi:hypothetical protein